MVRIWLILILICFSVVVSPVLLDAKDVPRLKTYVYKKVGELEVKADVYQYGNDKIRPVIVWIHGGALINGHRKGIPGHIRQFAFANGYVLVSIDYRLAPETKLPAIVDDVEDAFKWLRWDGPKLFHADPDRIAVCGGSAGGYLTLTSGFRVNPRPSVLVSFWGYGDLVGDWYSKPSLHRRHQLPKLDQDDAWAQVSGPPVSDSRLRKGNGGAFYQFCRQHGLWPKAVSGWDPNTQAEKFFEFMAVKNVDSTYPPTMLIHGIGDTDVPHEQSVMMARELKRYDVEHKLISLEGEHGLAGADRNEVNAAYQQAFKFLKRHLEK